MRAGLWGLLLLAGVSGSWAQQAGQGPASLPIVSPTDWGAVPPDAAMAERAIAKIQGRITGITVHHQGEIWVSGSDVAAYLRRLQQWSRQSRPWVDLPYHYVIAPEGTIFAGRPIEWAGDSNTDYDTRGQIQVMLLGNFEEQQPTAAQLSSAVGLLAHLMRTYDLPRDAILAHRHHTAQTVCPGAHLMVHFDVLRDEAVRAEARRSESR